MFFLVFMYFYISLEIGKNGGIKPVGNIFPGLQGEIIRQGFTGKFFLFITGKQKTG